ncbi:MAG: hypothetical protein R6W06_00805 [Prochlorococcaceae cyanobacterium]
MDQEVGYTVAGEAVVVNASSQEACIGAMALPPWRSAVLSNCSLGEGRFIVLSSCERFHSLAPHSRRQWIEASWEHAYQLFGIASLKHICLWRSPKDRSIREVELNLWFAPAGTACGIHNEHPFLEVHTQVNGLGIMQQFAHASRASLTGEIYMAPGYTHEPFADQSLIYPWHQYLAVSDCLWLAIEFHPS